MKKYLFILIITLLGLHGPFNPVVRGETIYVTHDSNQQPQIGLNRSELYFAAVEGGAAGDPQEFLVSNSDFDILESEIWDEKNAVQWIVARKI